LSDEIAFTEEYVDTGTVHRYRVIRLWEQDPAIFLEHPALLPLAPLTKTNSPQALLSQTGERIAKITSNSEGLLRVVLARAVRSPPLLGKRRNLVPPS